MLRIYDRNPDACGKETDLHRLIGRTVPVPEILHAEPRGIEGWGPFVLMSFVQGVSFRELKRSRDERAIGEASASVGRTLAAISGHVFPRAGPLLAGLTVGEPFEPSPDPVPRFVERCLESPRLLERTGVSLAGRVRDFVWSWAPRLALIDADRRLVHGDFNSPNLLVHQAGGAWSVAAVLDWEFAFSGSSLFDVGNFLRYERAARPLREPAFSRAFREAGGATTHSSRRRREGGARSGPRHPGGPRSDVTEVRARPCASARWPGRPPQPGERGSRRDRTPRRGSPCPRSPRRREKLEGPPDPPRD